MSKVPLGLPLSLSVFEIYLIRADPVFPPVYLQDERLSSFGAEEKLAPANLTRGDKKKRLDAVAAAEILEAFLEQKRSQ